jgi:GNAT superfamily N-acetyltransferase
MSVILTEVGADEVAELLPLLLLAEPSERALRWSLANLSDTVYRAEYEGQLVGAATMRWNGEPHEIVELAVAIDRQRQGVGGRIVEEVVREAKRRGKLQIIAGTANSSIGNIIFYQRCGFRMDRVRRDYFWFRETSEFENGIEIRGMIVFRRDLGDADPIQAD